MKKKHPIFEAIKDKQRTKTGIAKKEKPETP